MSGCRILDDKELEEQAVPLSRSDMRLWLPNTIGNTRIFDRGFIKPFPKAFQAKTYTEEIPSISTIQVARPVIKQTTSSLLDRVRGILTLSTVSTTILINKEEEASEPYEDTKTSEQVQGSD